MPVNYYPNGTEEELVALLESLQRRATTGEVNFTTIPGGGQMGRTYVGGKDVETTMRRIIYALHLLNPADYDNPYLQRVRRTVPSYVNV
jgi:hypothetical protein